MGRLSPGRRSPLNFPQLGSRELVAEDCVYTLKRHATTRGPAPFLSILTEYLVGMDAYAERVRREGALRQAISIAIDWEERSRIFPTDGGETAMSPIPPGLSGSAQDRPGAHNPVPMSPRHMARSAAPSPTRWR